MELTGEPISSIDIERSTRRTINNLNLTPLIDVLFILIIFFMLTTSFMRVESLELILPSTTSSKSNAKTSKDIVRIMVHEGGDITLGKRKVNVGMLNASLKRMFEKDDSTKIMLLTAEGVTMQELVNVMDRIYMAGGKSLYVRKWQSSASKKERGGS